MTADKKEVQEVWISEREALERAGVKSSKTLDEWARKYGYAEAKLFQGRRRRNLVIIEVFEAKYPDFARKGMLRMSDDLPDRHDRVHPDPSGHTTPAPSAARNGSPEVGSYAAARRASRIRTKPASLIRNGLATFELIRELIDKAGAEVKESK